MYHPIFVHVNSVIGQGIARNQHRVTTASLSTNFLRSIQLLLSTLVLLWISLRKLDFYRHSQKKFNQLPSISGERQYDFMYVKNGETRKIDKICF